MNYHPFSKGIVAPATSTERLSCSSVRTSEKEKGKGLRSSSRAAQGDPAAGGTSISRSNPRFGTEPFAKIANRTCSARLQDLRCKQVPTKFSASMLVFEVQSGICILCRTHAQFLLLFFSAFGWLACAGLSIVLHVLYKGYCWLIYDFM
jgi:hypothetical protein